MSTHAFSSTSARGLVDGATVLVKSIRDHSNPPTAMRGTVVLKGAGAPGGSGVAVALEYPDMFNTPAHHRTIELTRAQAELLAGSEREGVYELALDVDLNPAAYS